LVYQSGQVVSCQHVADFHRFPLNCRIFHCLQLRHGDDAFGHAGFGRLAGFEAASEVFDVVLVFTGVMALAFEPEIMVLLPFKPFDDGLPANPPRVTQLMVVGLTASLVSSSRREEALDFRLAIYDLRAAFPAWMAG
jgi:hypothetical protein